MKLTSIFYLATSLACANAATLSFDVITVSGTGGATDFGGGILSSANMGIGSAKFTLGTYDASAVASAGTNVSALAGAFSAVAGSSDIGTLVNDDAGAGPVPGTQTLLSYTVTDADFNNLYSGNPLGLLVESGADVGFYSFMTLVSDTNPDPTQIGFSANFNPVQATALVGSITSPGVEYAGTNLDSSFQLEAIPEPSASLLGLIGGIALLVRRRR